MYSSTASTRRSPAAASAVKMPRVTNARAIVSCAMSSASQGPPTYTMWSLSDVVVASLAVSYVWEPTPA
jgi:hypothetical protein